MGTIIPNRRIIVLTGGPCGGKTTLIDELCSNPQYSDKLVPLPEAIFYVIQTKISTKEKLFQKIMLEVQTAIEMAIDKCIEPGKIILCHRGSLDPLAYWLNNSWNEDEFYGYINSSKEKLYTSYHAVIHLETAAVNAKANYKSYPDAHRHESAEQAAKIDSLLVKAWNGHPNYFFIESCPDWEIKRAKFYNVIRAFLEK